jgi:hypothetical protein
MHNELIEIEVVKTLKKLNINSNINAQQEVNKKCQFSKSIDYQPVVL